MHFQLLLKGAPEWEQLRRIRNECREYMTGDRDEITPEQQSQFEEKYDLDHEGIYLLRGGWDYDSDSDIAFALDKEAVLGFLYLRRRDPHTWTATYGVREDARGMGYGKLLVAFSQAQVDQLAIEVLKSNHRALTLYEQMGFQYYGETDDIYTMLWRRK